MQPACTIWLMMVCSRFSQNDSEFTQICRTPPSMRAEKQAELIEAMGPGACQGR